MTDIQHTNKLTSDALPGMAKRHGRETRFRLLGLAAIVASLGFLVFFLASIFSQGYGAFFESAIKVDVNLDPIELGLPENAIPIALLFFNLGVEAGQILFITAALLLWQLLKHVRIPLPKQASYAPAYAIGAVAAFWTAERIASFWS